MRTLLGIEEADRDDLAHLVDVVGYRHGTRNDADVFQPQRFHRVLDRAGSFDANILRAAIVRQQVLPVVVGLGAQFVDIPFDADVRVRDVVDECPAHAGPLHEPDDRRIVGAQIPRGVHLSRRVMAHGGDLPRLLDGIDRASVIGAGQCSRPTAHPLLVIDRLPVAFAALADKLCQFALQVVNADDFAVLDSHNFGVPLARLPRHFEHAEGVVATARRRDERSPPAVFEQDRADKRPCLRVG